MPRWATLKEAATVLQVHPRTVQRMVDRGELRGRHVGRRLEVELKDDAGTQSTTPLQSDTQGQDAPGGDSAAQLDALRMQLASVTAERDKAEQQSGAYWQELVKLHDTMREINANMARMQSRLEAAEQRLSLPAPSQQPPAVVPPAPDPALLPPMQRVTQGMPRRTRPRTWWERLFGK